jgi:hypothetical protein
MRQPAWLVVPFAFCCAAFMLECGFATAQDDATRSTIRLCSAVEPARASVPPQTAPQERATAAEQDLPPQPVSESSESETAVEPTHSASANAVAPAPQAAAARPRMPAGFYPNDSVRAALSQAPGRVPIQSAPRLQTKRPGGKPFQSIQSEPAVSPYLYLNSGGRSANFVTNYFGFVRPQLDQLEANRQQQRDIQQLKSQMRKMSTGASSQQAADSRSAAHYMDTAQFYRGLQR